jgi:hypothetical protein
VGKSAKETLNRLIEQLIKYETSLYAIYNDSWIEEWSVIGKRVKSNLGDDLVDCSR